MRTLAKVLFLFSMLLHVECSRPAQVGAAGPVETEAEAAGPLSAADHDRAAAYHAAQADQTRAAAEKAESDEKAMGPVQCFDQPVEDEGASGGEGYKPPRRCWAPNDRPSAKLARESRWHEEEAASHERQARQLRDDEREACTTLSATDPNPLAAPRAVASVAPHRESGQMRGASLVLRAEDGRTARSVEAGLACHLARLAVEGRPDDGRDPLAVPGVETLVSGDERDVVVVIRVPVEQADEVLGRARALAPR